MRKITYLLILLLIPCFLAFSGGWTKGKGKGFFKANQYIISGSSFYDGKGEIVDITTTGVYISSLYGEYGIGKKTDLIGYFPLVSHIVLNDVRFASGAFQEGDQLTSLGDAQLGIKYGLRQNKPLVVSASLILGLPIGNDSGGETMLLQTGDGEFNQMLRLEAGYGFSFPLYTNIGVAFNNRTKGFSEEIRFDAEIGYKWNNKALLAFKAAGVQSLMNGTPKSSGGNGIFSNNLEYLAIGPEVSWIFNKKWGITAGYRTAVSGQFIIASPSYEIGVFLDIK